MREFSRAFLCAFALIIAETVVFQQMNYIYSNVINLIASFGVFFSISLGSTLALSKRVERLSDGIVDLFTSACYITSLMGFIHLHKFGFIWVVLCFLGFGIQLSRFYSRMQLLHLIYAVGSGSLAAYISLPLLYKALGSHILSFSCLATLAIALVAVRKKHLLLVGLLGGIVGTVSYLNKFSTRSFIERKSFGFKQSKKVIETSYTPLILTDLIWAPIQEEYYILTNGSRFSEVIDKDRDYNYASSSYDPPYLIKIPKKVLIIGPAGGRNVQTAIKYNVPEIYAVDINPAVFDLMNGFLKEINGGLYLHPTVKTIADEGRHYLETTKENFDLIVLQGVQTGSSNNIVNTAVLESFLFTKEAVQTMWHRLNPGGMLFIEEYEFFEDNKEKTGTLLTNLARLAEGSLGLQNFSQHVRIMKFPQAKDNPNARSAKSNRLQREAILISKEPFGDVNSKLISQIKGEMRIEEYGSQRFEPQQVTDNSPFFIKKELMKYYNLLVMFTVLVCLAAAAFAIFKSSQISESVSYLRLLSLGISYITFVMACMGPASLLIGSPQLSTPLVYTALFLFSMIGGAIALAYCKNRMYLPWITLFSYLLLLLLLLSLFKDNLLSMDSLVLRGVVVFLVLGIAALLMEIPYVQALNGVVGRDRAWLFAFGKLGVFVGIPFGICLQMHYGFLGTFCASLVFLLMAFLLCNISVQVSR